MARRVRHLTEAYRDLRVIMGVLGGLLILTLGLLFGAALVSVCVFVIAAIAFGIFGAPAFIGWSAALVLGIPLGILFVWLIAES